MSRPAFIRGDKLAARKVGGEMVILSAEDSSLFLLNEVGTAIWEAADGQTLHSRRSPTAVCAEYDVDRERRRPGRHRIRRGPR